jgi:alpha-methylacyl-CoA racemase
VFECADGKWITLGAIEPQFYTLLAEKLQMDLGDADLLKRMDKSDWPGLKQRIADMTKTRPQKEWTELLEGTDVCFAPVLSMTEAPEHAHNRSRNTFINRDGVIQPGPAPRFDRTPSSASPTGEPAGDGLLHDLGYATEDVSRLKESGIIA